MRQLGVVALGTICLVTNACDGTGVAADADAASDAEAGGDADLGDVAADADVEGDAGDGGARSCTAPETFSFFVMSLEAIQELSGSAEGFGGDLGGLAGADEKCQAAAESVGSCRTWHAFLSVTDDGTGTPVDAIDRIGAGPWYDVNGWLVAADLAGLLHDRPDGDDDAVAWIDGWGDAWVFTDCLTTERGNCNHSYGDTHDTLTGSDRSGRLIGADRRLTCNDWTSTDVNVQLPVGHSWPRDPDGTDPNETHWITAHPNCNTDPHGGPPGPGEPSADCNGCAANINVSDTFEEGVGGDGGYGAWYCFAID